MFKYILFILIVGSTVFAAVPAKQSNQRKAICPSALICNDQIAAIQASQKLYNDSAAARIAQLQASITAMPSPAPSK